MIHAVDDDKKKLAYTGTQRGVDCPSILNSPLPKLELQAVFA